MNRSNPLGEQSPFLHAVFRFESKIKPNKTSLLLKITGDLIIAVTTLLGSVGVSTRELICQILSELGIKIFVSLSRMVAWLPGMCINLS